MININNLPVITIDGPSGSGKGTAAQTLATQLGWHYLDSGAVYRVLAYAAIKEGLDDSRDEPLVELSRRLPLEFASRKERWRVLLDGVDVTRDLRDERVGSMASKISVHPQVRAALLDLQRGFLQAPGLVTDGRDMGTVVFPDATLKIYLEASADIRAERRYKQLKAKGLSVKLNKIYVDLTERDQRDRERSASPTRPADDAVVIDTSLLDASQVVERIALLLEEAMKKSAKGV